MPAGAAISVRRPAGFVWATWALLVAGMVVGMLLLNVGHARAATETGSAGFDTTWDIATANWIGLMCSAADNAAPNFPVSATVVCSKNIGASAEEWSSHEW